MDLGKNEKELVAFQLLCYAVMAFIHCLSKGRVERTLWYALTGAKHWILSGEVIALKCMGCYSVTKLRRHLSGKLGSHGTLYCATL